jgi:type I restriction enzyme S subunit
MRRSTHTSKRETRFVQPKRPSTSAYGRQAFLAEHWPQAQLSDIALINPESVDKKAPPEEIAYVDIASVSTDGVDPSGVKRMSFADAPSRAQRVVREGDVIISTVRPYLRARALVGADHDGHVASTGFCVLRPGPQVVSGYLDAITATDAFYAHLESRQTGTAYPAVRPSDIADAWVSLPPIAEQMRIADLLAHVDAVAERMRERSEGLQTLMNARREALLVPAGSWHLLPDGWRLARLDDVVDLKLGFTKGRKLVGETVELPYLRAANVHNGELRLADVRTETVLVSEAQKWRLESNDLLLIEGGNPEDLGRGWIWEEQLSPCIHQNSVFRGRLKLPGVSPRFLAYVITCNPARKYCEGSSIQTSNIAHIGTARMAAMPVPIPPEAEQLRMVGELDKIRTAWEAARTELTTIASLRSALISQLTSGSQPIPDSYDRFLPDERPSDLSPEATRA